MVRRWPDRFQVFSLVAGRNLEVLIPQILEFKPRVVVVASADILENLRIRLAETGLPRQEWPELLAGGEARVQVATAAETDFVISAIVGVAGLEATYEAVWRARSSGWPIRKCWFRAEAW